MRLWLEYIGSPVAAGRRIAMDLADRGRSSGLLRVPLTIIGITCTLQLAYQLLLQHYLLIPFRLGHITLDSGAIAGASYSLTERLLMVTSVFSSASVAAEWVLASLYLFIWSSVFSSKTNFLRLLVLNAYAISPIAIFSFIGITILLLARLTLSPLVWGSTPLEDVVLSAQDYKAYLNGVPIVVFLKIVGYVAEACSLCLFAIGTFQTQKTSRTIACVGTSLYALVFYAVAWSISR